MLRVMRDAWPTAPDLAFRLALKKRDIKVNGQRVSTTCEVQTNDHIEWYTIWEPAQIHVLYQDQQVLLVNKPAGLSTDRQNPGQASLLDWAQAHVGEGGTVRLVHRLDQQTSGLLLLALDDLAEERLGQLLRERRVKRQYTCLVGGNPPEHALLEDFLLKDALKAKVTVSRQSVPGSRPIITEIALVAREGELSRLRVTLHTGRTHQIRAHLAFHGWPIVGDDKYGDRRLNKRQGGTRLRLAATKLELPKDDALLDISGTSWQVEAPF